MARFLLGIIHATFVLPFTAGLVKDRIHGAFSVHDGSISGIVLLTTLVIIVSEVMLVCPTEDSRWLMIGLLFLAVISLIICSILVRCRSGWCVPRKRKVTEKLKLVFIWIFCCGNIIFQASKLALYIECQMHSPLPILTLYYVFTWLFNICQTIFIHYFSRFRFANNVCLYYILMFIFVTNLSAWTHRNLDMYYEDTMDFTNTSGYSCNNTTELYRTVKILKPFLDPVLLEYCLLSLIFISEMWPKKRMQSNVMEMYDSASFQQESSENDVLLPCSTNLYPRRTPMSKISVCIIGLGIIFSCTFSIVQCVLMYIPAIAHYSKVPNVYYLCGNFLRIPLTIKCFYDLSGKLQPKQRPRKPINTKHFIILVSSLATCGFYILESLGIRHPGQFYGIRTNLNTIARVIATVLQTIFILQMKQYRISGNSNSFFSIRNTFLIMCVVNFDIWFSYTVVTDPFEIFSKQEIFDSNTWLKLKHFWLPFVIFYHFECFIRFYYFFKE